jgi:hypothetical protein
MDEKYFPLGTGENSMFVRIVRIIFGVTCITVAVFWTVYNIRSMRNDWTIWTTILFLMGFGFYQIWSGMGRANRFIRIEPDKLMLRNNPLLPVRDIEATELIKIELLPLNIIFYLKSGKKILLRFGTTYHETNEKIIDAIISFTKHHGIEFETIEEEI